MLTGLETVNRLRHPNVGEAYIKWRSQSMLVRRLWEDAKFPGVDPDPVYVSIPGRRTRRRRTKLTDGRHKFEENTAQLSSD